MSKIVSVDAADKADALTCKQYITAQHNSNHCPEYRGHPILFGPEKY